MEVDMSFDKMFREAQGKPVPFEGRVLVRIDRVPIEKNQRIKVEFVETNSDWKQGIILETKGDFMPENGEVVPFRSVFWEDTAPKQFEVQIKSKNKELLVYNVWDVGNGTMHYWHNGAAMEVKAEGNVSTYYCNDGYPDTDFNDLIFKIELLRSANF
jgi:hypothetical protein